MEQIDLNKDHFTASHVTMENLEEDGYKLLRIEKTERIMSFDINSYVALNGSSFHNGIIEADLRSNLAQGAPDFSRGFLGIAFRITEGGLKFESYYLRPTNGKTDDPVRKSHGSQYFSYPGYTFEYFREHGITKYDAPIDNGLNEWIHLKAYIHDARAEFFLNYSDKPTLVVEDLIGGPDQRGEVGFFTDIGTIGDIRNFTLFYED